MTPALRFLTSQTWAMEPGIFGHLVQLVERHAWGERTPAAEVQRVIAARQAPIAGEDDDGGGASAFDLMMDEGSDESEPAMEILGRTAVIPITGVIARYASQVNGACQDQGRSADSLQADLSAAATNAGIDQVVLVIDSPGGTVAGTAETADAIRQLSASGKKVIAWVDGFAASAAYWLASQADEIHVSAPTALVGSIGVITAYADASAAQEKQGYKIHVIRSAALKAPGTLNEKLSKEQLASINQQISELHNVFASAVQAGRGLTDEQLDAVTTGQMWTADVAKNLGLIDGIGSLASVLADSDPLASTAMRARSVNRSQERAQAQAQAQAHAQPAIPSPTPAAPAAGLPTPAAAAATPKDSTMKITEKQLAALVAEHTDHAPLIVTEALAGAEEGAIRSKISEITNAAAVKALGDQVTALTAERDSARSSLATATANLTALQAKHDKLTGFKAKTPTDPGHGDPGTVTGATMDSTSFKDLSARDGKAAAKFLADGGVIKEA